MADNNPFNGLINNPQLANESISGTIFIPDLNRAVEIKLESEDGGESWEDFEDHIDLVQQFIEYGGDGRLKELGRQVSVEITESAYEQDDELSSDQDFLEQRTNELEKDLNLKSILVFEDAYLLNYESPSIFPGAVIVVQLMTDFEVDDISINE